MLGVGRDVGDAPEPRVYSILKLIIDLVTLLFVYRLKF